VLLALTNDTVTHTAAPPAGAWNWSGALGLLDRSEHHSEQPWARKGESRSLLRESALGQWMLGVAVVLVLFLAHVVLCCTWSSPVAPREAPRAAASSSEHSRAKRAEGEEIRRNSTQRASAPEARSPKLASYFSWKALSVPGSSGSLESSGLLSARSAPSTSDVSMLRGACVANTLCPQLVVPENCTLQCALPSIVCRKRQNLIVSIHSLAAPGGTCPFHARLAEGDGPGFPGAGIHLEMLGGEEEFAFLSTEDVWASQGSREPEMEIARIPGARFATIRRTDPATYTMARGAGTLLVFSGRFARHELHVSSASGHTVARVTPGSAEGMYEVVVYTNTDAGLIILGLLAIDKAEIAPS